MSEATEKAAGPVDRWVTFRLAREIFGINVLEVQEVLRVSEITPVPGAPAYVLGIINLRGKVITVADARRRFAMPAKAPDEISRIIILENATHVMGILVDSVHEVVEISQDAIESPPNVGGDEQSKYIQGVCSRKGELLVLIDLNKLFADALKRESVLL